MNESSITNFCIKMLSDENVKREVKNIYTPAVNTLIQHIMPYIYIALIVILINFILLILILSLLVQNKLPKFSNLFYKLKS
jgi:hypothetical protein